MFTLLPCCFFGFLSRKLCACRSGDFELTGRHSLWSEIIDDGDDDDDDDDDAGVFLIRGCGLLHR